MLTLSAVAVLCFFCIYQSTALNFTDGSEPFYRKEYRYVPQQEAWYKVHRERRPWYDAYQYCKLEGAALLYPRDQAEDTLLQQMAKDLLPNYTQTWVGAHDFFADDIYVDLQGKEIPEYLAPRSSGEPKTSWSENHCIVKYHNGLIGIESCESYLPFVCKRSIHDPVVITPCGTFDTGYLPNADSTRCYKLHEQPKTWKGAYKVCHLEGSYLVVIEDEEEAKFIVNLVKSVADRDSSSYNRYYTVVGFHDIFAEGDYVTINGKTLGEVYNQWGEGEPNNREEERYGSLRLTDARLNDLDGYQTKTLFVCEREIENPSPQTTTPLQVTTESSPSQ